MISIFGGRAANVDITWYHWPCNIDITKNRFYMAARIDKIVISELVATDPTTVPTVAAQHFPVNSEEKNEITCGNCLFQHFDKQNRLSCKKIPSIAKWFS